MGDRSALSSRQDTTGGTPVPQGEVAAGAEDTEAATVETQWDFAGLLRLADVGGTLGLEMAGVCGEVSGSGRVGPDGELELDAHADLSRVVLAGWALEQVAADIVTDPVMGTVVVSEVTASAYGGEVGGSVEVEFGRRRTDYQMSVTARDVQLSRYLAAGGRSRTASRPAAKSSEGVIFGNLILRGWRGGNGPGAVRGSYREGMGEVFIREAQVWELPIVFAIFQVLNLTPDENVFHDGWLRYSLSRDELTFQRIDLQGKAVSLVGGGRMDLRTRQLDLKLLAGSPVRIRVPLLTDIVEGASRELMEIKVTGTLKHPRITPQPLKSLTEALRTLFPEPPRGRSEE